MSSILRLLEGNCVMTGCSADLGAETNDTPLLPPHFLGLWADLMMDVPRLPVGQRACICAPHLQEFNSDFSVGLSLFPALLQAPAPLGHA